VHILLPLIDWAPAVYSCLRLRSSACVSHVHRELLEQDFLTITAIVCGVLRDFESIRRVANMDIITCAVTVFALLSLLIYRCVMSVSVHLRQPYSRAPEHSAVSTMRAIQTLRLLLKLRPRGRARLDLSVHLVNNVSVHLGRLGTLEFQSARSVSKCSLLRKVFQINTYVGVNSSFSMENGSTIKRRALTCS
jgi:hypothetical protein